VVVALVVMVVVVGGGGDGDGGVVQVKRKNIWKRQRCKRNKLADLVLVFKYSYISCIVRKSTYVL
jgi:hypothetical protein